MGRPVLEKYVFARLARAELFEQLGRDADAEADLEQAATLARTEPGRREIARRLSILRRWSATTTSS